MYFLIVMCLWNLAIAAVIPEEKDAIIFEYDYHNDGKGNYEFSYVTSNGIRRNEKGNLVNEGQDNEHIDVQGSYSYTDTDGKSQSVQYTVDENGYHVFDAKILDRDNVPRDGESLNNRILSTSHMIASLLGR